MFLREKLQITLGVLGIGLVAMGIVFVVPRGAPEARPIAPATRGTGFWKDHNVAPDLGGRYGPWLIGAGAASLVAASLVVAFMVRPR